MCGQIYSFWNLVLALIKLPRLDVRDSVPRSSGGGKSEPMPSLPAGTATSQPHRTPVSQEEIDFILVNSRLHLHSLNC